MRPIQFVAIAGCFALFASGCGPVAGTLGASGYKQPTYNFSVSYRDPSTRSFLGPDWDLDNFYPDESGQWQPKTGPEYEAVRLFDSEGDGNRERLHEFIYDLRFINRRDHSVIWVKAHPLEWAQADFDLDVILSGYADGLSGTTLYAQIVSSTFERPPRANTRVS